MRHLYCVTFLLLLFIATWSQQPREYVFTNYSTSTGGLATNLVNCMTQDDKGYMWIATYNGLQRFDGYKFLTFRNQPHDRTSIPDNNIKTLFIDQRHRLWMAGNDNRIGYFNTAQLRFTATPAQTGSSEKSYIPKHFLQTASGTVILYEEKGNIYSYDEQAGQFRVDQTFVTLPTGWKQNRIAWDHFTGKYWIGCDSGLVLFNPANKKVSYRGHNTEQDPVINQFGNAKGIETVFANTDNTISFYTKQYPLYQLYYYNRHTGKATIEDAGQQLGLNFYEIHGLFHQRNGRSWVHGVKLFAQWRPEENTLAPVSSFYNAENKIKSNYVNYLFEDRESNVWAATDNGLFVFNPDAQLFYSYRLLRRSPVKATEEADILTMSTFQTKTGITYIGTWQAGLFLFDKQFNPAPLPKALQTLPKDLTIWSVYEQSATGLIWLAVEDPHNRELMVYDPKRETLKRMNSPVFEGSAILTIEEDREGNLWFGTRGGHVVKWDQQQAGAASNKGFTLVTKVSGVIREFLKDHQGYLWVVTAKNGLLKVDAGTNRIIRTYTEGAERNQLTGSGVIDILQYNDSTLLVATETNLNVIHTKQDTITKLSTADGLPANTIRSMQKDQQGIIWLGMLGGICRVNLEKKTFTTYDRKDGIPYDNFVAVRGLPLQNGRLLFCTSENLLVIDPSKAVQPGRPARPLITSFYLANQPLRLDSLLKNEVKLNYDNSSISIGFSNLHFLKQRTLRYYYKLEGLDKDWVRVDAARQAQYNYIPPGTYTFYVKSANEDGVLSKEAAVMQLTVMPPFWKTGLFYALLTLFGLLIIFLIDRERIKRLRTVQQMRSQIAGDLHKDIHGTLNDINVLSAMAKIKADKDIDRSKDFIDTISIKSRDIMESMEDILWTLDPENDSLKKMLLRIQEYTEGLKNSHKALIELNSSPSIKSLVLDMRSRHELLLFYKHALSFILHKSPFPTIQINLDYTKGRLTLYINAQGSFSQKDNLEARFLEEEMHKKAETLKAELQLKEEQQQIGILLQLMA